MLKSPVYDSKDLATVKRLIADNPWATFVSATSNGLVASHYPIMLEESDDLRIISHFGRPDDEYHELGQHEILVIVQGPHGYVSPSWYENGQVVPTWNHLTVHLYGRPERLDPEETFAALDALTTHFEGELPEGKRLAQDAEFARNLARGTAGLRLTVERFQMRLKLSQNKELPVVRRVVEGLERSGPYRNRPLAREMRAAYPELFAESGDEVR